LTHSSQVEVGSMATDTSSCSSQGKASGGMSGDPGRRSGALRWLALAGFIGACLGVGYLGNLIMGPESDLWYSKLLVPAWAPPDWLFGPVWTALYILMGTAAWLVWSRHGVDGARLALGLFALQLGLNAIWTPLFFGL